MPEEKKARKPKEERTETEQAFMDAVHFWRKHPYAEAWVEVVKRATVYKQDKTKNADAQL